MPLAQLTSILFGLAGLGFLAAGLILRGHGGASLVFQVLGAVFLALCLFWLAIAQRRGREADNTSGKEESDGA
jgi:Zn-dependent protease with chaperone function